jgi:GT2 family glycosyltransferase
MSNDETAASVLVVIVNYRTPELTMDCLRSLEPEVRALGSSARVVVVDGGSGDGSAQQLASVIEAHGYAGWASLLALDHNGGFAHANNAAIAPGLTQIPRPDYVYLLNPDTTVFAGALQELLRFMREHPRVGIAGSRCENADGSVRPTAFRFHSALGELESQAALGPISRLLAPWAIAPAPRPEAHRTDWVSGAAMLVRREVFEQVGLLDDEFFLYYEETDFAARAAAAGFECWYVPSSRIVHLCGQASGVTRNDANLRRVPPYFYASRRRYFEKHHGRLYAVLADCAWLLGAALRRLRSLVSNTALQAPPKEYSDFIRHNLPEWINP